MRVKVLLFVLCLSTVISAVMLLRSSMDVDGQAIVLEMPLTYEVYGWCEANGDNFCTSGEIPTYLLNAEGEPVAIHWQGGQVDFGCQSWVVSNGISATYWDGSQRGEIPAQGGSRAFEACEAIFRPG